MAVAGQCAALGAYSLVRWHGASRRSTVGPLDAVRPRDRFQQEPNDAEQIFLFREARRRMWEQRWANEWLAAQTRPRNRYPMP